MGTINDTLASIAESRRFIEEQMTADILRIKEKVEAEIARIKEKGEQDTLRIKERYNPKLMAFNKDIESLLHAAELTGEVVSIQIKPLQLQDISESKMPRTSQKGAIPIGDAIETVLREVGRPMKVSEITEAIQKMGIFPDPRSLRSTLSGDYRKRFMKTDYGVYTLHTLHSKESPNESSEPSSISSTLETDDKVVVDIM